MFAVILRPEARAASPQAAQALAEVGQRGERFGEGGRDAKTKKERA